MVAKSSHILVHIVLGRSGLMGKVLVLWSNGEEQYYYPHMCKYFKSTPSFSIILIRVIRIVNVKLCKSSSVRGCNSPMMYYFGW